MNKRSRSADDQERTDEGKKKRANSTGDQKPISTQNACRRSEAENCCFMCKNGGKLYTCNFEHCVKVYHPSCLRRQNLTSPSDNTPWHCSHHICFKCHNPSTFRCYCCPKAVCSGCVDAVHFLLIKEEHGFCYKCRKLAIFLESEMVKYNDLSRSDRLFKGYYENIKEDECLDLKDLQSREEQSRINQKEISDSNSKENQMEKFEPVSGEASEVHFNSIFFDNLRLVYLTRSLVEKLLKEPDSFESKVKGSYVRVKFGSGDQRDSYELMQVNGTKKASSGKDTDIKLLLLPRRICISVKSLSDSYFFEEECEDLRQKMNDGLLKKPTVEELQEKAESLHEDITDYWLAREKRTPQEGKLDYENEKGLNTVPEVIPKPPAPSYVLEDASGMKPISGGTVEPKKEMEDFP